MKAPLNKFVAGTTPIFKTPLELSTGQQWWPDVTKPRRIRDKGRYAARVVDFENEYDLIFKKPSAGYFKTWREVLVTRRDPGEAAYNRMRTSAYDFLERTTGKSGSSFRTSPKSEALYNMMLAKKRGDNAAYVKARLDVYKYSENRKAARKSINDYIERSAPLAILSKKQRREYLRTLTRNERRLIKVAEKWHRETFK